MRWSRCICWIACLLAMSFGGSAHASCDAMLPALEKPSKPRAITADDLIGLRDIGVPNALAVDSPFGISPDGGHVAFVISRADADRNAYCFALAVLDLEKGATPRIVDRGGEPIRAVLSVRGLLVRQGYLSINRPIWSPDGRWLAYLRRDHGVTQVWRVASNGSKAEPVTSGSSDVERFAWTGDGKALIVERAADRETDQNAPDREALNGYVMTTASSPAPAASRLSWPRATQSASASFLTDLIDSGQRPKNVRRYRRS